MLTGAMQAMIENMMRDALQNLPPEMQEKIGHTLAFIASVDQRLTAMDDKLSLILATINEREKDHDGSAEQRNDHHQLEFGELDASERGGA